MTLQDVAVKAFNVDPVITQLFVFVLTTEYEIGLPLPPDVLRFIDSPTAPESIELLIRNGLTLLLNIKVTDADVVVFRLVSLGFKIATTLQVVAALEVR